MRVVKFDKAIYLGEQVDAAVKVYTRFGTLNLSDTEQAWVVEVDAGNESRDKRLAGEIANYALGLTVRMRRANMNVKQ